jgi:hypothetical protein
MPRIIYTNKDGDNVPSVTTVLKALGEGSEGLIWWAWNLGMQGKDYRAERQAAADIGTLGHLGVEADISGEEFDPDALDLSGEDKEMVRGCLQAWEDWKEQSHLSFIASELSLVSEDHQYGGTLDVATVYKRTGILDLKTGNGVYPSMLCQIAAYGNLWNEAHPDNPIEDYHLLRISKDGSFHHHHWRATAMIVPWATFKRTMANYHSLKLLKKMV